jgi:hypothetical protein
MRPRKPKDPPLTAEEFRAVFDQVQELRAIFDGMLERARHDETMRDSVATLRKRMDKLTPLLLARVRLGRLATKASTALARLELAVAEEERET